SDARSERTGEGYVENRKVRHRGLTAHARARYRCFLPDLAGLAGVRRARPMPDQNHSSKELGRGPPCPSGLPSKRRVTFGARTKLEGLPFFEALSNNRSAHNRNLNGQSHLVPMPEYHSQTYAFPLVKAMDHYFLCH